MSSRLSSTRFSRGVGEVGPGSGVQLKAMKGAISSTGPSLVAYSNCRLDFRQVGDQGSSSSWLRNRERGPDAAWMWL